MNKRRDVTESTSSAIINDCPSHFPITFRTRQFFTFFAWSLKRQCANTQYFSRLTILRLRMWMQTEYTIASGSVTVKFDCRKFLDYYDMCTFYVKFAYLELLHSYVKPQLPLMYCTKHRIATGGTKNCMKIQSYIFFL